MSEKRNKVLKEFSREYDRTDEGFYKKIIMIHRDDPTVSEPLDLDVLIPKYTPEGAEQK